VKGCCLFWSSFFDDYIVFSPPSLAKSSELSAIALFKLLGWVFAEEGRKCKPFSDSCEALGVVFDLKDSGKFVRRISNTASRVEEISEEIRRLLETGFITPHSHTLPLTLTHSHSLTLTPFLPLLVTHSLTTHSLYSLTRTCSYEPIEGLKLRCFDVCELWQCVWVIMLLW
jgi:hypothetical protein